MEEIKQFWYIGSTVTEDNCCTANIKKLISFGKQVFEKRKKMYILINIYISIEEKMHLRKHLSGVLLKRLSIICWNVDLEEVNQDQKSNLDEVRESWFEAY